MTVPGDPPSVVAASDPRSPILYNAAVVLPVPVRFACAPRRWRFPLVVLGVLACVTLASDRAAASGELRIGISRVPATLDPAALAAGPELMALRLLFQGLVEFGERGDIGPALATQWTVSRAG